MTGAEFAVTLAFLEVHKKLAILLADLEKLQKQPYNDLFVQIHTHAHTKKGQSKEKNPIFTDRGACFNITNKGDYLIHPGGKVTPRVS